MDTWLEIIVFGVISIAVWEAFRAIAKSDPVASRVASIHKVQRVTWDLIKTRDETIRQNTPFWFSWRIFQQMPADIFENHDAMADFRKIQQWLEEDAYTSTAEEIYLVARDWPVFGTVRAFCTLP